MKGDVRSCRFGRRTVYVVLSVHGFREAWHFESVLMSCRCTISVKDHKDQMVELATDVLMT